MSVPRQSTFLSVKHVGYINKRTDSNYTDYFPIDKTMVGKKLEVFVLAYQTGNIQLQPEVWLSAYSIPFKQKVLTLILPK